jgi:hypothetical protein
MVEKEVNGSVKIVILPTVANATYLGAETKRIQETVRNELLFPSKQPYHKVQVTVRNRPDGAPKSLVAFMLRAYTYTVDIARINLDSEYGAKSVTFLAGESDEAGAAPPDVFAKPTRAARQVDMVFGTPEPEIPTAKAAVEYAYDLASKLGYKAVKLVGKSASVANYRKYLRGHLKAFGNVGHGYTGGIVLSDGNLTSSWFDGLANDPLSPGVIYFNSCQTFNPPLQPAVMNAGARTFVGGKVNLLIGNSEEVFKCFWTKVLKEKKPMGKSLRDCEKADYPVANAHGLSGGSGKF